MFTQKLEVSSADSDVAVTDYRAPAGPVLPGVIVRSVLVRGLAHVWTGGPGGHPFCEKGGPPLTALCVQFLRDAGLFGAKSS